MDYLIKIYYLINGEAELIEEQWYSVPESLIHHLIKIDYSINGGAKSLTHY